MAAEKMEILLEQGNQNEAEEVMEFLETLDQSEKKEFLAFMRGAKFARTMTTAPAAATATA